MSNEYQLDTKEFHSLKIASSKIFDIITKRLNVQTVYVTKKGKNTITVLSAYNREEHVIPEGYSSEYEGIYGRLVNHNRSSMSANLIKDELTKELEITSRMHMKGFLSVTLTDLNGHLFGTLCVMDKEEKEFTEEDIHFLQSIANLLSHMIELDQTQYNMALLSVPIIPITKGVAILTIQGIIDERRADKMMKDVLRYATQNEIDYFIIDLSGLVILDRSFPHVLITLVQSLQVMGVETIMTGITPKVARREVDHVDLIQLQTKTATTMESALSYIGFSLVENNNEGQKSES